MKICAVICEFNPFHNGHKYVLEKARELSGCDAVLCVMSGNFTQRAEYAVVDKNLRTDFALKNGADFVVELPLIFATSNGTLFARGAVSVISQIKGVTHLAFGCESGDGNLLETLAKTQLNEHEHFKSNLKKLLDEGIPYAKAYSATTRISAELAGINGIMTDIVLSKPNNLLAIEYIKEIYKQNLNINIVPVKRIGADFNDNEIKKFHSSASALRINLYEKRFEVLKNNVPENCIERLKNELASHMPDKKIFDAFIIDALRRNDLSNLLDAGEGLEIKLNKNAQVLSGLDEIFSKTKSKRYTLSRIRRLGLQALFNIKKDSPLLSLPAPLKLLGVREEHKDKIGFLSDKFIIRNKDYEKLSAQYGEYIKTEKHAASVYGAITSNKYNFFSSKLVIV